MNKFLGALALLPEQEDKGNDDTDCRNQEADPGEEQVFQKSGIAFQLADE
jgi:hypothetical protein